MDISGRTVLIVGGTSGIGLGLARRFVAAGSTVIVGGRNTGRVDDLETAEIDVTDPGSILRARDEVLANHPDLDVVVTMSGVMLFEDMAVPSLGKVNEFQRHRCHVAHVESLRHADRPLNRQHVASPARED